MAKIAHTIDQINDISTRANDEAQLQSFILLDTISSITYKSRKCHAPDKEQKPLARGAFRRSMLYTDSAIDLTAS